MNQLIAICSREKENGLIGLECENLTGGIPDADGVAVCREDQLISRAAYIRFGVRCLAEANTLPELIQHIAQADITAEGFRIDCLDFTNDPLLHKMQAILSVANVMGGSPNLDAPQHRFILGVQKGRFWFGEQTVKPDRTFERHRSKPCRTSSSLPSHLARALVNLIAPPAGSILDPCCGTGTILLEAQSLGMLAYGCDWNANMVEMTRKNLACYGYQAVIEHQDARDCRHTADALITDLPYGKLLIKDDSLMIGILQNTVHLAPLAVYVAGEDISHLMAEAGYEDIEVYYITRHKKYLRYIHRAHSRG